MMNIDNGMTRNYFLMTEYESGRPRSQDAAGAGCKYARVAGATAAEALMLLPKVVLGNGHCNPSLHDTLRPSSMSLAARGIFGCISLAAGKLIQYAGAAVGTGVGALASIMGALAGCNVDTWADRAAGKGWQVGTFIASAVMIPSQLVRPVAIAAMKTPLFTVMDLMGYLGSLVGQGVDLLTTTPLYTRPHVDGVEQWRSDRATFKNDLGHLVRLSSPVRKPAVT